MPNDQCPLPKKCRPRKPLFIQNSAFRVQRFFFSAYCFICVHRCSSVAIFFASHSALIPAELAAFEEPHAAAQSEGGIGDTVSRRDGDVCPDGGQRDG